MHGWLVIHNHFFANTADISHKSSTSETGVLQEFPILWKGVPERFFLAAGVVGLPTSVPELQHFPALLSKPFLGIQSLDTVCSGEGGGEACWKTAPVVQRVFGSAEVVLFPSNLSEMRRA